MTVDQMVAIMNGVIITPVSRSQYGGQNVGVGRTGFTLTHPDFDFSVTVSDYRSQIENKNMCITLFELFIMERLK